MGMVRHAVFMLAFNQVREQYNLTVQAVESVLAQNIGPLDLVLIDNGSTGNDTSDYFQMVRDLYVGENRETRIHVPARMKFNVAPTKMVNRALDYLWNMGHDKILSVANDTILPPYAYALMNDFPRGFVTASESKATHFPEMDKATAVSECTPCAVGLIRKWFHDALVARDGYFLDEGYFHYASDCDLALRMASCGIRGVQLDVPFYHYGSASHLLSPDGQKQRDQADADRRYFESKWNFKVDAYEYGACAQDINFKGLAKVAGQG